MRFIDRTLVLAAIVVAVMAVGTASAGGRFEEGAAHGPRCKTVKPFECRPEHSESASVSANLR